MLGVLAVAAKNQLVRCLIADLEGGLCAEPWQFNPTRARAEWGARANQDAKVFAGVVTVGLRARARGVVRGTRSSCLLSLISL